MTTVPRCIAFIAAIIGSCTQPVPSDREHEPDELVDHEHEQRHDQVPRSVTLAPVVIEQAGVVTALVERRSLAPTIRLPGEVAADPDREASVAARIEGVIESIRVRPGDALQQGDILATVRAPNIQSLRAAEAALRAKAASARANADRITQLVPQRMASQQEATAATAEASSLEAEARAAKERLRALGIHRSRGRRSVTYDVRAPMDGIVLQRNMVAGAPVTAQTVVATMVAAETIWFLAHVFERDLARVNVGSDAAVYLNAYPDQAFNGHVDYLSHQVDPGSRTLSVRIPLANPNGKLRLGLYGTAHVVTAAQASPPVIAVPNSAITRMQGKPVAFVRHTDGHFEVHDVVLGESDTQYTEIIHGLREGEHVVSEGALTIKSVMLRDTFAEDEH